MDFALANTLVAALSVALTAEDAAGKWVQLTPAGKFRARNGGPYDTGDQATMKKIIETTRQFAGSTDLVVDYDHQAITAPSVGGRAPAAGWIKELEARPEGIFGRVEWTEAAASAIKAGEYRYISPVFLHEKTTGRVLLIRMAGLTNTPALDMMQVAASALLPNTNSNGDSMDKILAALGLAKGTDEDGVVAAINSHLTNTTAIAKAVGLAGSAKNDEILTAVNSLVTDRAKFAKAAGLAETAKADEIVTAVNSAVAGARPDPTKFVPIAIVADLQSDLKKLREDLDNGKAEEAVNSALAKRKISPKQKEWALDYAKADLKAFETFVGNAPVLLEPQIKTPKKGEAGEELNEAQLAVCSQLGIKPEDMKKNLAERAKA